MNDHPDAYVVVPMYNEATVIAGVVHGLRASFANVICVDDGSSDRSAQIARDAGAVVLEHVQNIGQGAAIQTGLLYALSRPRMRFAITFDADGQHRVSDAEQMLKVAREGDVDVVLGSRFLSPSGTGIPASRMVMLRAARQFTRLVSGLTLTDAHNGLRVFNRHAAQSLDITLNGMAHASEIIDQIAGEGLRWVEQPVTVDYTKYSINKGQRNINAVNVTLDILGQKLRSHNARRAVI